MKTREQFVKRWSRHLAGLALYGLVSELRESTMGRASRALDIPAEVERLLTAMYDDLDAPEGAAPYLPGAAAIRARPRPDGKGATANGHALT